MPPTHAGSSPRLAAQYNIEHDPIQSDQPVDDGTGGGLLRSMASGRFASDRFSAAGLVVVLVGAVLISIAFMGESLMDMVSGARDLGNHPAVIGNPSEAEERRSRFERVATEKPSQDVSVPPVGEQRGAK